MDEEKKEEEQPTIDDSKEGDKPQELDAVRQIREEREELAEERKRVEKANTEAKEIIAIQSFGGRAEAGGVAPEETKETDEEFMRKFHEGEKQLF